MGASESTARPNATNEEESQQESNSSSGNSSSTGAMITAATAVAAVAGVAWGISKMLSDDPQNQERNRYETGPSLRNSHSIILEAKNRLQRSVWSPPSPGRFKINTDGSCHSIGQDHDRVERGPSGYGGILRDHRGNWVRGFIGFIGESDCLTSELHGIWKGLELLDKMKLKGSVLETDSEQGCKWVNGSNDGRSKSVIIQESWHIIMKCRKLVVKNEVDVKWIPGDDANKCAHELANMAIAMKKVYKEMEKNDVPSKLMNLVEKDANRS